MNGYRLRVWVGRDGIMPVSCFPVSIVVNGFSCVEQSLRCLLRGRLQIQKNKMQTLFHPCQSTH